MSAIILIGNTKFTKFLASNNFIANGCCEMFNFESSLCFDNIYALSCHMFLN